MKKALTMAKKVLILLVVIFSQARLSAATYGTNFTDGSILAHQTITGADNIIQHQAKMDSGFSLADNTTTCSFNSYYPVGGGINLNSGKLFLNRDLDTKNTFILGTAGHIVGNKHTFKLYERDHTFFMPYFGSFTLTSSFNTLGATNSVRMSYDNAFLATGAASNAGPEVRIFSINETSFTITPTRAAEFGSTVNSVSWHPTSYYLAAGGATGINIYRLNTSNGTLSTTHTFTFASAVTAVAFSPDGNYLAFGGGTATTAFAVRRFANGLIGGTASPVTIPGTAQTVSNNAISWKSTGDYVVIGVTSGNTNSNKVQVYSFNSTTLALTTDSGYGSGAASATDCLNVAWRSGQSEIAVGFNGALGGVTENVRVFRHTPGALTELTSSYVAQTKTVNSVRWNALGELLFVGTASGTGDEGIVYAYLDEDALLTKISGVDFASDVQSAVWDENGGHFLILGWADTHARMYKFSTQTMLLENVHLIMDTDVQLKSSVRIRGLVELHGNGNFLDFSEGYTIFIESGGAIEFIGAWIKNYGENGGQIFMADNTCVTEFVNSTVELSSNVYTHSGSVVTEGPNTFILKNYDWNFDYKGTLTVEHASLILDNTQYEGLSTAGKVRFGKYNGGPIAQYLDYSDGGTVKTLLSREGAATAVIVAESTLSLNNSNAIAYLDARADAVDVSLRTNSNALLYGDRVNSNALLYGDRVNSNAIVLLSLNARTNSNALLYGDRVNSNAIVYLDTRADAVDVTLRTNSNALLYLTKNNSNAIIASQTVDQAAEIRANSNALLYLTRINSNALLYGDRVNSNAIVLLDSRVDAHDVDLRVNSNAIVYLDARADAVDVSLRTNSNALLYGDRVNSNAIGLLSRNVRVNSNALLYLTKNNSNAIIASQTVDQAAEIRANSNALLYLTRINSNALLYGDRVNSNAIVLLSLNARTNSNALLYGDRVNSNALLYGDRVNSNAIVYLDARADAVDVSLRTNSNALLYGDRVNSNVIGLLSRNVRTNSNALLYLTKNNSNAIIASQTVDQAAEIRANSNALLYLTRINSNALLYGDRVNSNAIMASESPLTNGPVITNITLNQNTWVLPGQTVIIGGSVTIDGQGASVMFSHSDQPQFIVDPGMTVRLKNISLRCITANTFDIGTGATLEIDQNVFFELCSDVAFMGDTFNVLGDIDNPNVFTIRGYDAQRRFVIEPVYEQTLQGLRVVKTFNLGYATINLENVEFTGVESVKVLRQEVPGEGIFVGTFALANRSTINVDVSTNLNFFVDGPDNALRFLLSDLTLSGFVDFSDEFDSELHLGFHLGEKLLNPPVFSLADDALFLGSDAGRARLIFDDYAVTMRLLGTNSFVTDNNAFIGGQLLEILRNPIKQFSNNLTIDAGMEIFGDIDNPIDSSFIRSVRTTKRAKPVINALKLLRQRYGVELDQKFGKKREQLEAIAGHKPVKPAAKPVKKQEKKQQKRDIAIEPLMSFETLASLAPQDERTFVPAHGEEVRSTVSNHGVRLFNRPDSFDLTLHNQMQLTAAAGTIEVSNGSVFDFGVSAESPLNLYLLGDTTVAQGAADLLVKAEDGIFVEGQNNIIKVTKNFVIEGQLNLNEGTNLIFEFDKTAEAPAVIFKSTAHDALSLPTQSRLEFRGKGAVWFQDGFSVQLEGTTALNKAILSVTESAALHLGGASDPAAVGSSVVTIHGTGHVIIDSGARLFVEGGQRLIVGSALTDDIDVLVDRGAIVSLSGENQSVDTGAAALSFQLGTYSIDFQQKALLDVGKRGVFEINALNNVKKSGKLKSLSFAGGGSLSLDHDGTFVIGQNALTQATKQEIPFTLDLLGGEITGDGMVRLAQTPLEGRIQNFLFRTIDLTAQSLVRSLINRVPSLTFATVFLDVAGDQWLFNKSVDLYQTRKYTLAQTIFKLLASDDIRQDNATTGNVHGYNNGVAFVILPDASRQ